MSLTIGRLDATLASRWDGYVAHAADATFFHRAGWADVLERGVGHTAHYLYAERAGALCGVLPLGQVRSRWFGHALISAPFGVYGGPLADDEHAREALERAAVELAEQLGVDHLEMRLRAPRHADWESRQQYVRFRKRLEPEVGANLAAIPRKQRAMVRKGMAAGLQSRIEDDLQGFYAVYAESVRNLGTPVFPYRLFETLKAVFGADCEVLGVTHRGRPVAAVMSFYFRDEVLPYYGGGTGAARRLRANDFMYWELMRRACERGLQWFDYGRSRRGSGSYAFKRNWGFEPEPLYYEHRLVRARALTDVSPANPRYRSMVALWRRLPLPVSRWLGPLIARDLA